MVRVDNFECKCSQGDAKSQRRKETIKLNGDILGVVDKFCYLGDMLNQWFPAFFRFTHPITTKKVLQHPGAI